VLGGRGRGLIMDEYKQMESIIISKYECTHIYISVIKAGKQPTLQKPRIIYVTAQEIEDAFTVAIRPRHTTRKPYSLCLRTQWHCIPSCTSVFVFVPSPYKRMTHRHAGSTPPLEFFAWAVVLLKNPPMLQAVEVALGLELVSHGIGLAGGLYVRAVTSVGG